MREAHMFKPYWMKEESIDSFFFIDFYGPALSTVSLQ